MNSQVYAIIGALAAFAAILAGAYKLGAVSERQNSMAAKLDAALGKFGDELAKVTGYIEANHATRSEWSNWRGQIEQKVDGIDTRVTTLEKAA
jgi:hypothetical protein